MLTHFRIFLTRSCSSPFDWWKSSVSKSEIFLPRYQEQLDHSAVLYNRSIIRLWEELCVKAIWLSSLSAHWEMPFNKQNSRGNSKTFVINRIMHGNRRRHKTERNISEPGFRITHVYSPPGTGPQFIRALLVCTALAWRGSPHIPRKCWWGLDLSLSPSESGWLFSAFPCVVMPGLSQLAFLAIPLDEMSWLINSQRETKHTHL